MNMLRYVTSLLVLSAILLAGACSTPPVAPRAHTGLLKTILDAERGRAFVLLLGRDGCPGTQRATEMLSSYAAIKPEQVTLLRLDVPLPEEALKVTSAWDRPFARRVDEGRGAADQLGFFFYPTLYVFDRDGVNRFEGGCDTSRVDRMVRTILSERPGQAKPSFNLPMPAIGNKAPKFKGMTLDGREVTLVSLKGKQGLLLYFARTSCPFSVEGLGALKELAAGTASNGLAMAVINEGEAEDVVRSLYQAQDPGVPVVWDREESISKAYGVEVTPYYYLLGPNGVIVQHRSFTAQAALNSVRALLNHAPEKTRFCAKEAG